MTSDVVWKILFLFIILAGQARAQSLRPFNAGLQLGDTVVHVGKLHLPVRIIVARIDPRQFDAALELRTKSNGMTGAWNVDSAGTDAVVAFNAGQFKETGPWGWLVIDGKKISNPGFGPLSSLVAINNTFTFLPPDRLTSRPPDRQGFQSYPTLLRDGRIPRLLLESDDVDRKHRDARLILGETADGSLLVVLMRLPVGMTVMESMRFMRKLGARDAVMLDGGLSAQMLVRDSSGLTQKWKGLRDVPLALVFRRKADLRR